VSAFTNATGDLIQYRYNANGSLSNLVYPGNKTVTYLYDSLNRLTNVTDWGSRQTTFTYDLASRMTSVTRPNGTVRQINYDAAGETTNIVEKLTNGAPIAFFRLNWDNAARVQWEFAAPLPQTNTAPPTRTMTYNADNQITTLNNTNTLAYNSDGNMTTGPLTNSSLVSYGYDARNRLTNAAALTYGYDPAGNRTSITNGTNVVRFVVNPNAALPQMLIRTQPDGSQTFYVYGVGLLYEVNFDHNGAELNTRTHHYDYRGSTVAITDASGNVTDRVQYSAYGMITLRGGTNDTPFLYNGRYGVMTDPNGLLYMRARYYNPYLCRFINPDPVGFGAGLNWYCYADGNPISNLDPFGLWSWTQTFGVARSIGGGLEAVAGASLGAATSWTGIGAVAGGAVAVHGLDQLQAGIRQAWSGSQVDSLTSSGLQTAGVSRNAANLVDAGISMAGSLGASTATSATRAIQLAQTSISADVATASLTARMGYYEVGQLSLSEDANAFYSTLWPNALDRGAAMVADQGWMRAMSQASLTLGAREGTLFTTGLPTPLGSGLGGAVGGVATWLGRPISTSASGK
jgi:RHS repeat-associated protein